MKAFCVTKPTLEPIMLAETKLFCRVDHDLEDGTFAALITAAREHCEQVTGRALLSQTWERKLDDFSDVVYLPRPPLISITSVKYYDTSGVEQTLSTNIYEADIYGEPGCIRNKYNQVWPTVRNQPDAVAVRYTCGYGTAEYQVPWPIRLACLKHVDHAYSNRETVVAGAVVELPLGIADLLAPYVIWDVPE
jgi:uncharacterized phiE125 gp8 family phage protein